jgi:hypothetical protein
MQKFAISGFIDAYTWFAKASHDLTRIRPKRLSKVMNVSFVIMAAKYCIHHSTFCHSPGNIRVMIDRDFPTAKLQLCILTMESDLRMLGGYAGKQKLIPVIVPKNHVDWTAEAAGDLGQGEWSTEIPEEKQVRGFGLTHQPQRYF